MCTTSSWQQPGAVRAIRNVVMLPITQDVNNNATVNTKRAGRARGLMNARTTTCLSFLSTGDAIYPFALSFLLGPESHQIAALLGLPA